MQNACKQFGVFCSKHQKLTYASFLGIGAAAVFPAYHSTDLNWLLMLWIAAVVIPPILGLAGKVQFKWVILWEMIMFAPIGIIIFLLFGTAIVGMAKR